jgi:uncharacterized protein
MFSPDEIYSHLRRYACSQPIEEVLIGLTWTLCRVSGHYGLAMSPGQATRTLPWSGSLQGRVHQELIHTWLDSWHPYEITVAIAALNAVINTPENSLLSRAKVLPRPVELQAANLAVFEYFLPQLQRKKVVVVGRYPGLSRYAAYCDLIVLERQPSTEDWPDSACEYVLPQADWVFLTATSLINRTFPRLASLSANAQTVLMGPTVPWLAELAHYHINYLAGIAVCDSKELQKTVAEGGGIRIFERAVEYRLWSF